MEDACSTKAVKACLFDLDGVIVDTAKYHYMAWRRLANELGFEFAVEDNERLKGVSRTRSLEILLEIGGLTVSDEDKAALADRKNEWYVEYITQMDATEVLPGVVTFMNKLRQQGIKVSLGSASKNSMTILQRVGIASLFDAIIDGTQTTAAKPDPEVFLLGALALGVDPAECLVFEDAAAGIEAAKRAGMRAIGIGSPEVLKLADWVVGSFMELEQPQHAGALRNWGIFL